MKVIARMTREGQTTIPAAIRAGLGVAPGDALIWELQGDATARVRRAQPVDVAKAVESTLTEWATHEDERAYRGL
jgi:AbrB family looped-hinge helix DNA binding protein